MDTTVKILQCEACGAMYLDPITNCYECGGLLHPINQVKIVDGPTYRDSQMVN